MVCVMHGKGKSKSSSYFLLQSFFKSSTICSCTFFWFPICTYLLDFFIDCLLKFSVTINWLLKDWLTWPLFDNIGQLLSLLLELINRLLNKSFFIQTRHAATGTIFYGPAKFDLSWYIGPKADTGEYEICLSLSNRTIIIKCLPSMPVHNWNLDSRV